MFCSVLSFSFDVWVEVLNVSVPLILTLYTYLLNKSLQQHSGNLVMLHTCRINLCQRGRGSDFFKTIII